jgi:inhibitor of KinA sporulation pathway (predicted exonuclease)
MVTNTLRFGPRPELSDAWISRGDIDMEEIRSKIRDATGKAFRAQIWNYIDDRNHLHAMVTKTLRFGPRPELNDAWISRGDIDIEEILRVILNSVGPVDMKIGEANAPTEITQIPLIIKNIMENSFLVTINTWTTKIHDAIDAACGQITQ